MILSAWFKHKRKAQSQLFPRGLAQWQMLTKTINYLIKQKFHMTKEAPKTLLCEIP